MKHLYRLGAIWLTIVVAVIFLPRMAPNLVSLADYGFHPKDTKENAVKWAGLPVEFAQSALCNDCHQDKYVSWQKGDHSTVSCENCHGPARTHLEKLEPLAVNPSKELCAVCHSELPSRPADFPQIDAKKMSEQPNCTTCHNPHDPRAGLAPSIPHSQQERTDCQSCHNPHESLTKLPPRVPHTVEGRADCRACHSTQKPKLAAPPQVPHPLEGRTDCVLCHNSGGIRPFPKDHAGRTGATCLTCHRST